MNIGIDLVSGESPLKNLIAGGFDALKVRRDFTLTFIGKEEEYRRFLLKDFAADYEKFRNRIKILNAPDVVTMEDDPLRVVRQKKESSIVKGLQFHKDGEIDAFFSPGNTGAIVVAASLILGRIKGIKKPALVSLMPNIDKKVNLFLDVGASTECDADDLLKFAIMGSIYAEEVLGIMKPKVGLLNIGEEKHKGNKSIKQAFKRLSEFEGINFYGNVEGYEIFSNIVNVIVCDGYIGNISLKVAEGAAKTVSKLLKEFIKSDIISLISLPLYFSVISRLKEVMDPERYGGAPLLGVNGNVFIGHGKSGRKAIKYGILIAAKAVEHDVLGRLKKRLEEFS